MSSLTTNLLSSSVQINSIRNLNTDGTQSTVLDTDTVKILATDNTGFKSSNSTLTAVGDFFNNTGAGTTGNFLHIMTTASTDASFAIKTAYNTDATDTVYDVYQSIIGSTGSLAAIIGSTGTISGVIGTVEADTVSVSVLENESVYDTYIEIASTSNDGPFYSVAPNTTLNGTNYPTDSSQYSAVFTSDSVRDNQIKAKN